MEKININDIYNITINKITFGGEGIARLGNLVVFIPGAVVGDMLKIKITELKKNYARGEIVEILEKSPHRIEPPCKYYEKCGGCNLQHIDYKEQLRVKKEIVEDSFFRFAKGVPVTVQDCIASDKIWGFRNKIQWVAAHIAPHPALSPEGRGGEVKGEIGLDDSCPSPQMGILGVAPAKAGGRVRGILGLYEKNSHNVVDIDYCLIADEEINKLSKLINVGANNSVRPPIKHIIIRKSLYNNEIITVFVVNDYDADFFKKFAEELVSRFPALKGVIVNINDKETNVVLGKRNILIMGKDFLQEKAGGLTFYYHGAAFFQINVPQLNKIIDIISKNAGLSGKETVLDLYSGAGVLTLHLNNKCGRIILIEETPAADEILNKILEENNIKNAEFVNEDVDTFLRGFCEKNEKPDLIILDPPRKGCTEEGIEYLKKISAPKIIYLSCNPVTLARDCKKLAEAGYVINLVQPVDMFPQTYHVETLAVLERSR